MKKLYLIVLCLYNMTQAHAQAIAKQREDSIAKEDKEERRNHNYAYYKYSFNLSVTPYTRLCGGADRKVFGAIDLTFSDRVLWLDVGKNGSLETNYGIAFMPYQGTKLHAGSDYELLSNKYRFNLCIGGEYAMGLNQLTSMENNSSIKVGFHHYLTPFLGFTWWPGKNDKTDKDLNKVVRYIEPGFNQLIYFKLQIGYSFLLNSVHVDSTGAFDAHLYHIIRNNTASTLNVKITVGINIPTGEAKRVQYLKGMY